MSTCEGDEKLVVIFVEGRFDRVVEASVRTEAVAFCQGYCAAAERFRATTALYILPDDAEEMHREERPEEVRRAAEAAR